MEPYLIAGDSQNPPPAPEISRALKSEGYAVTAHPTPVLHLSILQKPTSEESIWVVKGNIALIWGNQRLELGPGDRAVIPAGVNYTVHAPTVAAYYLKGVRV